MIGNERYREDKVGKGETLGTKQIWKNFNGVGNERRYEGHIVKVVEQEKEPDGGMGVSLVTVLA